MLMICNTCGVGFVAGDEELICTECLRQEVSGVRSIMRASDMPKTEEEARLFYRLVRSMKKEADKDQGK
jgi:hypothetical protein